MELLDLVCVLSDRTKYTRRELRRVLRTAASIIKEELSQGRNVSWRGLGQFETIPRGPITARDPRTQGKTPIYVPPGRRFRFVASEELAEAARKSVAHFQEEDLNKRYLPGECDGKVCSSDRPKEGGAGEGEDSWEGLLID